MSVPALCVAVPLTTKIEAKGEQYQCGPWTPGDWMTWLCVSKMSVPWIWLLRMQILCALALQVFYRHLQTICHLHSRQNIRKGSFMSWRSSFFFWSPSTLSWQGQHLTCRMNTNRGRWQSSEAQGQRCLQSQSTGGYSTRSDAASL